MKQETAANLARISFVSVFAAFLCGCCLNIGVVNPPNAAPGQQDLDATTKLLIGLVPVAISGVGLVCGVVAVSSAIRNRFRGVLPMGIAGIIFNTGFFAFIAYTIVLIRNLAAEGKLPIQ